MNKGELVAAIAEETDLTQKQVEQVVTALLDAVKEQVAKGEKITLTGFGTFQKRDRKGRTGRNPRTGEEIKKLSEQIQASVYDKFGVQLQAEVNFI